MDYEKLAEKVYLGVQKQKTLKVVHIFTNSENVRLRKLRSKNKFDGDLLIFVIKSIRDHFTTSKNIFSNEQLTVLEGSLSIKEYEKLQNNIVKGICLSHSVKFCINLYNLIFTQEVS